MAFSVGKLILVFSLLVSAIMGDTVQATESYTWYFIRHAEKTTEQSDPVLSERGQQRAQQLAKQLEASGVKAIYSTGYKRTEQTAQPLADQLGLPINRYAAGDPQSLLLQLQQAQHTSLIVGHSNTIPALVRLAGGTADDLSEDDYGDLFVLELQQGSLVNYYQVRVELP